MKVLRLEAKTKIQILLDNRKKTRCCWQLEKAPFSDSRAESSHWIGCLEKGSQWGEIPEVMWLEEQSSEVLYDTYHHGLPFNQRVERKDKVKLSSPFSFNYSHEQEI